MRTSGILSLHGPRAPLPVYVTSHWPPRMPDAGSVGAYSNFGYTVLAAVVERVSEQRIEAYLAEHLFAPLGMRDTTAEQPPPGPIGEAVSLGYERADVPPTPWSSASPVVHEAGSTGVVAPADDVARFMLALLASAGESLALRGAVVSCRPQSPRGCCRRKAIRHLASRGSARTPPSPPAPIASLGMTVGAVGFTGPWR